MASCAPCCCFCLLDWIGLYLGQGLYREMECVCSNFKELEENEEYVEREDEFDLVTEKEKVKDSDINEDDEIDIMTIERDPAYSDSDMSQDDICYLPPDPSPDVTEQQDIRVLSPSNLGDIDQSASPLSEDMEQNEDLGRASFRRKRKLLEKVLEFQAENVKKSSSKMKAASHLLEAGNVS